MGATWGKNRLMYWIWPKKLPTSFSIWGVGIPMIALALAGSTLMFISLMMKPKNYPCEAQKMHLFGFRFNLYFLRQTNNFYKCFNDPHDGKIWQSSLWRRPPSPMDDVMEKGSHGPLISCPYIIETKMHDLITANAPRSSESILFLVCNDHLNLVVSREPIHEGHHLMFNNTINKHTNMG